MCLRWLVPAALVFTTLVLGACAPSTPQQAPTANEDWSGFGDLENVLNWTPEQQLRGYRNMDRIYPTRPVPASTDPFPLPSASADLSGVRYELDGQAYDIDAFMARDHLVGLLAIKDGAIVLERYAQGNTPETRWYSFSVAKSVVSMLIGAAVKDGYIESLDTPVTAYLPILQGSAYEGVSLRNAMQMASGVEWDEDYADPASDVASTGGSALDRLRYLARKPRAAAPGTVFNYNTGETNLLGAVLRAAIGNNLSTYLEYKIWRPFGMEHDANWLLLSEGGAEHGGCCISATLRDYGRLGLFAMRNGRLRDATSVLPDGWMSMSTSPSVANPGYGSLWWLRDGGTFDAVGIYGQAIHIDPANDLVIVTHGAWPQATNRDLSRHRAALFDALTAALRGH
ncbi:MAG: serine hydrolase domain-containing protein [Vicinamibacterales bacterium]